MARSPDSVVRLARCVRLQDVTSELATGKPQCRRCAIPPRAPPRGMGRRLLVSASDKRRLLPWRRLVTRCDAGPAAKSTDHRGSAQRRASLSERCNRGSIRSRRKATVAFEMLGDVADAAATAETEEGNVTALSRLGTATPRPSATPPPPEPLDFAYR